MIVHATIIDGAVTRETETLAMRAILAQFDGLITSGSNGSTLRFEGIVRRMEPSPEGAAHELDALEYTTYDPMAQRELESLGRDVAAAHNLSALVTVHSRGRVAVGAISFVLIVVGAHRAESLRAMSEFIDRLKQDVPIWKQPVWKQPV